MGERDIDLAEVSVQEKGRLGDFYLSNRVI